jgi:hypothetical protein
MALYDSTGREVMAMRWDAIADKPDRINEIAALVDPNELRYVGWNDISNELELLLFLAADIPYDNSGSGLAATDVQAAIDEVVSGPSGNVFPGRVSATGTTGTSDLPAGWTVTRPALGTYTVTHSLGVGNFEHLSVVCTAIHTAFVANTGWPTLCQVNSASSTANAFQIIVSTDFAGVDRVSRGFFFLAQENSGA